MWRAHTSILMRLGKTLHIQHDDNAGEPLPKRWVDLIHYLDELERQQTEAPKAQAEPREVPYHFR